MEAVIENGKVTNIIVGHLDNSLPLEDIKPIISKYQRIDGFTYDIKTDKVVKKYNVIDIPIFNIKTQKLQELKIKFFKKTKKPRVQVTISNSRTIYVDGGRSNKDDFKEKWENMAKDETTTVRDADNNFVTDCTKDDLYAIYQAIYKNGEALYAWKWTKEQEINACNSIEELEKVEI